jgi:hypothetical protein
MEYSRKLKIASFVGVFVMCVSVEASDGASIHSGCPLEKISEIDHQKWHRSMMARNGFLADEQMSQLKTAVTSCQMQEGWTPKQSLWVLEENMARMASDALADKLTLLDIDPYFYDDLSTWPLAKLEAVVQNPHGPSMQKFIDDIADRNDREISAEALPVVRSYISHSINFEIALRMLYGDDRGGVDISK